MFLVREYGFVRLSFAAKLKEFAESILIRPLDKDRDPRFLHMLGEGARFSDEAVWIRLLTWTLRRHEDAGVENFVLDDCRYLNEAQFLRREGFILIRLKGRSYKMNVDAARHSSEVEQDKIKCDYELDASQPLGAVIKQLVRVLTEHKKLRMYTFTGS